MQPKTSEPIKFGKYRLLDRISHGGMAEVFRAKTFGAAGFERTVAIKLLLPTVAMDDDFVTMLIDEAKIAGQLSHANIAQIFDLGQAEGRYYIVQEYINGRDLRSILKHLGRAGRRLTVGQACHIILKVCEGLEYAHNKRDHNGEPLNVVHRDVSPQNVVVSMEGEVKLIDFGIAKAEGRRTQTLAGLVKGKFAYMSPEQIRGLPVDRRSDVFATGIVLHELLTSKPLFRRKSEFETLKRARSGVIDPPSLLNPDVPPELDRIVLGALARHVEDRYQSAIELRDALWQFSRTSGHLFSRNELSSWMVTEFGGRAASHDDAVEPLEDYPSIEIESFDDESDFKTIVNLDDSERDSAERSGELLTPSPEMSDVGLAPVIDGGPSIEVDGPSIELAPHELPAAFDEPDTANLKPAALGRRDPANRPSQRMTVEMTAEEMAEMPKASRPRRTMLAAGVPAPVTGPRPEGAPSSSANIPMAPPPLSSDPGLHTPERFPAASVRDAAPLARPQMPDQMPAASSPGFGPAPDRGGIRPGSVRLGSGRSATLSPPSRSINRGVAPPPPATRSWWPLILAIVVLAGAGAATLVLILTGS